MKIKISYLNATIVAIAMCFSPCFANDKSPNSHISGWILRGANPKDYESGIDKSVKHSGKASAYVASKSYDSGSRWTTLMQTMKSDTYKGKRIRMSAWVKTENVKSWAGLWLRVDNMTGSTAFDNMNDRPIKGTLDWMKYEVVLDVDTGSFKIAFGVLIEGPGKLWIDDIKLETVGVETSTTGGHFNHRVYSTSPSSSNLSFEKISKSNNLPESWSGTINGNGYKVSSDHTVFHDGVTSACLESVECKSKYTFSFGTILGGLKPDSFKTKRVRMSGWIKTENIRKWAGLWMRVDGRDFDETLSFDNMGNRAIKGTTDWKKYEIVLDVPQQATNINFGALLAGTGKLWLDEVRFEVVGNDVASTSIYSTKAKAYARWAKKYAKRRVKSTNNQPMNLDFEG